MRNSKINNNFSLTRPAINSICKNIVSLYFFWIMENYRSPVQMPNYLSVGLGTGRKYKVIDLIFFQIKTYKKRHSNESSDGV